MGQHHLPGNPPIALKLRRSPRARRITLRVSALDGRVTLTLPDGVSEREAMRFAQEKEAWLRKHLATQVPVIRIVPGAMVPFEGVQHRIQQAAIRGVAQGDGILALNLADGRGGHRLRAWLKAQARTRLASAADRYSEALGKSYRRITMRDTRSRWGSCSTNGALNFSWRLVMAPNNVLEYVAAHEVAHLQEMNHSPAFWAIVERLYGSHDDERRWLKEQGASLHAIQFDAT